MCQLFTVIGLNITDSYTNHGLFTINQLEKSLTGPYGFGKGMEVNKKAYMSFFFECDMGKLDGRGSFEEVKISYVFR